MPAIARRTLVAAAFAAPALASRRAGAATRFVVTEPYHGVDSLPFYLAVKNGFFRDAGLDIEIVTAEGGGRHIAAVLSGDAQAFIGGPEHIAFAKVKGGRELRAVVSMANRANQYFCAARSLPINPDAPAGPQFKGRRIAVGTRGGTGYSILLYLMKQAGLDPANDATLVEIAAAAGRMAAVRAGQADIVMLNEPLISQGVRAGLWNEPFLSIPRSMGPFAYNTVNVPLSMVQGQGPTVAAMVAGVRKGLDYCFAQPDAAYALAREEFPTLPEADLRAVLRRTLDDQLWERSGAMPEQAWTTLHAVVRGAGLLDRDVSYAEVFDPAFLSA